MDAKLKIPGEVSEILEKLQKSGYEAYIVGGCVRDLLRGEKPKDWDVTTSAKPEEILKLFPESFYENKFLTVTVKTESPDETLKEIEVTTFRADGKYTDKRHPDEVRFAETLEEDLGRRDFTINALAVDLDGKIIDFFNGQQDLKEKLIRAVGDPEQRFNEDALRMLRAVRLAVELGFAIEETTRSSITKLAGNLQFIAKERIRDEFIKIVETKEAKVGVELLHELGLLKFVIPELELGIGVENRPRIFTIWEHNLKAFAYGVKSNFSLLVRIAALLHDIGKPPTKGDMKMGNGLFMGTTWWVRVWLPKFWKGFTSRMILWNELENWFAGIFLNMIRTRVLPTHLSVG
jgi:poly(A) polymerase